MSLHFLSITVSEPNNGRSCAHVSFGPRKDAVAGSQGVPGRHAPSLGTTDGVEGGDGLAVDSLACASGVAVTTDDGNAPVDAQPTNKLMSPIPQMTRRCCTGVLLDPTDNKHPIAAGHASV